MQENDRAQISRRDALTFERYALALLTAEALSRGQTLLIGNEVPRELSFADGFAPTGILDINAPCFIEVNLRLRLDRGIDTVFRARAAIPDASLVLVVRDENHLESLASRLKERFPTTRLRFITKGELEGFAKKHPAIALSYAPTNLTEVVSSLRSRPSDGKAIGQHLAALHSAYQEDRLALFMGAGVSKSVELPDWPELVRRLASTVFDNHSSDPLNEAERKEVQSYFESEIPALPLIVARLLRNSLKNGFADAVRGALYKGTPGDSTSDLLESIGALCLPQRGRLGITAVVNYNFDDLLEKELRRRNIAHRSIMAEGEKPLRSELPIYHVHGFLPSTEQLTAAHQDSLVLSEDAYHMQFVDPFLWTNITQLNLLRNAVCLFVGMSITDPNQRRLLEITASKDPTVRHYALMKDHWSGATARKLSLRGQSLTRVFKGLEEASLANLGVTVIWVDEFTEIPKIIDSIRT